MSDPNDPNDAWDESAMIVVAKPDELLALYAVTAELFATLQRWFTVPATVTIDVAAVDSDAAVREMGEPVMIAAFAMRKLQALHLLATPGVRTSTDVVVSIVQDLMRALLQAPVMRLRVQAASMDWDAAFALLDTDSDVEADIGALAEHAATPHAIDDEDPETVRFNELHQQLHIAVEAVLIASGGEIAYLV